MSSGQLRDDDDGDILQAQVRNAHANRLPPRHSETSFNTGIHTLPNVEKRELVERSVMCTGPTPTGGGSRSEGRSLQGRANGMTGDEAAQRPRRLAWHLRRPETTRSQRVRAPATTVSLVSTTKQTSPARENSSIAQLQGNFE